MIDRRPPITRPRDTEPTESRSALYKAQLALKPGHANPHVRETPPPVILQLDRPAFG